MEEHYKSGKTGTSTLVISLAIIITVIIASVVGYVTLSSGGSSGGGEITGDDGVIISSLPEDDLPELPEIYPLDNPPAEWGDGINIAPGDMPAILKFADGEVTVQREDEVIEAQDGMKIFNGDRLIVEKGTTASLYFYEGSVSLLTGYCEVVLARSEQTEEGSNIVLESEVGNIVTKVGKLLSSTSSHKVRTPNSIAGAWGTIYQVLVSPQGETDCFVTEGDIQVAYVSEDTTGRPVTRAAILKAGRQNGIRIPRLRQEIIDRLSQDLGLAQRDRKAIMEYLEKFMSQDRSARGDGDILPGDTLPRLKAVEILTRAASELNDLKTFHFEIDQEGRGIPILEDAWIITASGDIVLPDRLKMKVGVETDGSLVRINIIAIGDRIYMTNPLTGKWEQIPEAFESVRLFNPAAGIRAIFLNLSGIEQLPAGLRDGVLCFHIRGTIAPGNLNDLTGGYGIAEDAGDDLTVDMWIGVRDFLVRQIMIEGELIPGESPGVSRIISFSAFNEPVTVTLP